MNIFSKTTVCQNVQEGILHASFLVKNRERIVSNFQYDRLNLKQGECLMGGRFDKPKSLNWRLWRRSWIRGIA